MILASIPSPDSGVIDIGPLPIHFYGLMLAIGVLVAAKVGERRWARLGGDPALVGQIAVVVVIAGVVGARVYHLFTGYDWTENGLAGTLRIWEGGLSIWGAVLGGLLGVLVMAHRLRFDRVAMMDAIIVGVAFAQAIGRWGNWFNQELFGRPTDLPWGVEIDLAHRPAGFESYTTFHPTFLYESLWMVFVGFTLIALERRVRTWRRGQTFAAYVMLYTSFRVLMEWVRIDKATKVLGLRWNGMLSVGLFVVGLVAFVVLRRRGVAFDAPLRGGALVPADAATGSEASAADDGEPDVANDAGEADDAVEAGDEDLAAEPLSDDDDAADARDPSRPSGS